LANYFAHMTIDQAFLQLRFRLNEIYDDRESATIAHWTIEAVTGFTRMERIGNKNFILSPTQEKEFEQFSNELMQHKPVQYVLGEAWFYGERFFVNEHVLIPRPETELLVERVIDELKKDSAKKTIIDIGTGSGCIPICIQKKLPNMITHAVDVSEAALTVAQKNATDLNVSIQFHCLDFLDETKWSTLPNVDLLVSNPPYIAEKERTEMQKNVLDHEPHLALFVPNEDPLIFYKQMLTFSLLKLNANGIIAVEISEHQGNSGLHLFNQYPFRSVELLKDLRGADRLIVATK
jgi:release factor glutamine methyltransferase